VRVFVPSLLAVLALTPGSAAAKSVAPPGNSGIQQYTETILGPGGGQAVTEPAKPGSKDLQAPGIQQLERLGPKGKQAAAAIAASSPTPKKRRTSGASSPAGVSASPNPHGRPAFDAVVASAAGGAGPAGMGPLLPAILALTLAVGLVIGVRRTVRKPT
jgi:hypothetical protein